MLEQFNFHCKVALVAVVVCIVHLMYSLKIFYLGSFVAGIFFLWRFLCSVQWNSTTSWQTWQVSVLWNWYWISGELSDCISGISSIFPYCWPCDHLHWYDSTNGTHKLLAGWCSPEQIPLADQCTMEFFQFSQNYDDFKKKLDGCRPCW